MTNFADKDAAAIEDWLTARIANEVNVDPESLPLDRTFFELGMNSLNTLVISGELAEFLHQDQLEPSVFWDHPTIGKLAEHLSKLTASQSV